MARRWNGLTAGMAAALGLGAAAWPAVAADVAPLSAQEAADMQTVQAVLKGGGFDAIGAHLADLQAVLDHAPASYPLVEQHDGVAVMRDDGQPPVATLALLVGAAGKKQDLKVVRQFNTYPMAAVLIGAYDNEMKKPDAAIAALDRGLKIQPENSHLVSEKAASLFSERRFAEALAMIDPWLAANPLAGDDNRARLLRARGLALTELGRLDDSEASYRESLKLQPGHKGALGELDYIAKLRAGGHAEAVGLVTSDKAASVGRAAITPPPKP